MKKKISIYQHFFSLILMPVFAFSANGQQQFTQVAGKANSYCNSTCTLLDIPAINKNPAAILFATPVIENDINLNPHPVGVYYVNEKQSWSIINLDQAAMPPGSKFNVQYFSTPDAAYQFVHTVSKENLKDNNTRSFIDHPGLNNNPEAQFQYIIKLNGSGNNRDQVNTQYDAAAGKWYIYSAGKKALDYNIAFNISIGSTGKPVRASASNAIVKQSVNTTPAAFGKVQLILMTVERQPQIFFKGETTTPNKIELKDFNFEVNTARDAATGMATGRRTNLPIVVNKIFGASSLQFYKALINNEALKTVTIEFYTTDAAGNNALVNTIKLINARVSGYKQNITSDQSGVTAPKGLLDEIKLVFQSIEFNDASGFFVTDSQTIN